MSRNAAATRGALYASAMEIRRLTIVYVGMAYIGSSAFLLITQYSYFPAAQALLTALAIPLVIPTFLLRRRDIGAWFAILGMASLVIGTVFTHAGSDARVSASTIIFMLSYFGITLLPERWQLPWVIGCMVLWTLIVPVVTIPVTFGELTVNLRWANLPQLFIASGWLIIAWNRERADLEARDASLQRAEANTAASVALRERIRVWRESLVRVHETVLNDIRSIVDAPQINGARLRRQLELSYTQAPPRREHIGLQELVSALSFTQQVNQQLIVGRLPDTELDAQRSESLRSLLLELVRNMYRHNDCTIVTVEAIADSTRLHISLLPNVPIPPSITGTPGIGQAVVVNDLLTSLQATLDQKPDVISVSLPLQLTESIVSEPLRIEAGRVLLSSVGAGNAIGGAAIYLAVAATYDWHGELMSLIAALIAAISLVATWRRQELSRLLIAGSCLIATAVPWLAVEELGQCGRAELPIMVNTLVSLGLSAIIIWSPRLRWWMLALPFAVSTLYLSKVAMASCTTSVAPGLLASAAAPLLAAFMLATTRHATRSAERARTANLVNLREATAAETAAELSAELHDAIERAQHLMAEIADHESASPEQRLRLRCLDAEIRATIQVDPESAGTFAQLARALVLDACRVGVPVRVLTLRDSGNRIPVDRETGNALRQLMLAATDGSAVIQILTAGNEDTLILSTSATAATASDLPADWNSVFNDGEAFYETGSDNEPAVLMVRRSVTPAPDSSAHPALAR